MRQMCLYISDPDFWTDGQTNGLTEVFHEALAWLVIPHQRWHLVGSDVDFVEDIVVLDVDNDVVLDDDDDDGVVGHGQ